MSYYMTLTESDFFVSKEHAIKVETELFKEDFAFEKDEDSNLVDITWNGDRLRGQKESLDKIASLVKDGSYIEFRGEDDLHWCWYFSNSQCEEHTGVLMWPSMVDLPINCDAEVSIDDPST